MQASIDAVKDKARAELQAAESQLQDELSLYEEERRRSESEEHAMDAEAKERAVKRILDRILTVGE